MVSEVEAVIRFTVRTSLLAVLCIALLACRDHGGTPPDDTPARRIVSLAPPFTETLFALGRGDRVFGRTTHCDAPDSATAVPAIGDAASVNVESLLALRPDLVVTMSRAHVDALAPLGDRVRVRLIEHDTLEDSLASIEILGRLAEAEDAAARLVESIRVEMERAGARAAGRDRRPRILVVIDRDPFYVAGHHSFVGALIDIAGGANVVDDVDRPFPVLSAERIVDRAPEVILDGTHQGDVEEARRYWSRFPDLPAVRQGRVHVVPDTSVWRLGRRIPEAIRLLESILHPSGGDR